MKDFAPRAASSKSETGSKAIRSLSLTVLMRKLSRTSGRGFPTSRRRSPRAWRIVRLFENPANVMLTRYKGELRLKD